MAIRREVRHAGRRNHIVKVRTHRCSMHGHQPEGLREVKFGSSLAFQECRCMSHGSDTAVVQATTENNSRTSLLHTYVRAMIARVLAYLKRPTPSSDAEPRQLNHSKGHAMKYNWNDFLSKPRQAPRRLVALLASSGVCVRRINRDQRVRGDITPDRGCCLPCHRHRFGFRVQAIPRPAKFMSGCTATTSRPHTLSHKPQVTARYPGTDGSMGIRLVTTNSTFRPTTWQRSADGKPGRLPGCAPNPNLSLGRVTPAITRRRSR